MLGKILKNFKSNFQSIIKVVLLCAILFFVVQEYNQRCSVRENWIKAFPREPIDIGPPYYDTYYKELAEGTWKNNDDKSKQSTYNQRGGMGVEELLKSNEMTKDQKSFDENKSVPQVSTSNATANTNTTSKDVATVLSEAQKATAAASQATAAANAAAAQATAAANAANNRQ